MSTQIKVKINGVAQEVDAEKKPTHLFAEDSNVVVCKINGELRDLWTDLSNGDEIESVSIDSADGLNVLRHSTAHVLAQAVQEVFPETKLGIGPPIRDGFYYDFDPKEAFTPSDLEKLETAMRKIIKAGQRFKRRVTNEKEALVELKGEPYKCELIGLKSAALEDESSVEVGSGELTIYDNLGRDGNPVWSDLCRGPHLPSTKHIPAFKLMRAAGAYWRGSEKNPMLQRIYGTAWPTQEALDAYLHLLEEAEKRDHRRLGAELDLFSFPEEIGSGLAVFHPKGGIIRRAMEDYSRRRHEEEDYQFVYSPHLTKAALFETSGHLQWYADGMYPPMVMDEEFHADGTIKKAGQKYYMKPMNCPFHNLIYKSSPKSYRDLPLRLFEFGTVYRYEKSGVVHGITRARGFTQDDAHIYCTKDQMAAELDSLLTFVLNLLRDYGLEDFYLELSTRNPEKSVGEDADWQAATEALRQAAIKQNLELVLDPGGAAFYGPKISVQARDAIGRSWQMSTIQVDFQLPQRFDLGYAAADGTKQQPVMIHRALFGSIERFFGVLTEHYAGAFPAWLAPVQVRGIPVAEAFEPYLLDLVKKFKKAGIRADIDTSDDRMQKKIRNAQLEKIPYMMIVGEDDQKAGTVSFRYRNGDQKNGINVDQAIEEILLAIKNRTQI
ncbi:MAG: threonine--tRNA ligase [Actinobacteria bacterium]|uniref:threonine--tRNA ligase n=1 Tax=freshwater metagenome TaxID=449393 RepID=A0A6J7BUE0_9ZZZZ|nr:threonine--tRNA ligase [Actinomycetota bacterium]MSX49623.1 threonine--tRNA ligase [Actinomycetota bacterium]MSX69727.1 threonine--tRNA ligase [Actinomycetota bacterium]MSY16046.1 threonine--tRNA ligase [Actinomycetota bacterium]MSY64613.1 threonine--tRNA ligase [Actinomycetota bacterium]